MKGLLFTYALTYGGAVASLINPFYGLLIYICFAILRPELLWRWSVPPGNYSRIVAIALLIGWALRGFGDWKFKGARPIVAVLVCYWGWLFVSALCAANTRVALEYLELHSKILLPVLVGITLIDSIEQLRMLAWTMALSLGFLAFEANLDYLQGGQMVRMDGMVGMDNNSFCIAMVLGAGLTFFLGIGETAGSLRLLAFGLSAMMVHVPMIADSRGGMLGLVVLALVAFYLLPKRPAHLAAYALGVLAAIQLAGPAVAERFTSVFADREQRDASAQSRLDLWADGWDVMKNNPLTGIGPDNWPLIAANYGWPPGKEIHSVWVNAGAELGFPGVTLLLSLYGATIWLSWQRVRTRAFQDDPTLPYVRMTMAGLAGFMVAASFVSLDALETPYHTVLLGTAALKLARPRASEPEAATESVGELDAVLIGRRRFEAIPS